MGELTLLSDYSLDTTILSNIYIDEYMTSNNEAQVKIYLYLLRNLRSGKGVSVCSIADVFNYTVQDVERALLFMQKQGLMQLEITDELISGIRILPLERKEVIMFSAKPDYSKEAIKEFFQRSEIKELVFVAEQYIGKSLVIEDIQNLYYINNTLGLSEEVIEYLIEYCVGLKKKSFSYMAKVAKDWSEASVRTVEDAKQYTLECPKEIYDVFRAYGVRGTSRKPQPGEAKYVKRWLNEYGFSMDIIEKACVKTVERTHSVSFEYTDAILRDFKEKNVASVADIERLDEQFRMSLADKKSGSASAQSRENKEAYSSKNNKNNKFNSFSHREYDFDELEKQFLS